MKNTELVNIDKFMNKALTRMFKVVGAKYKRKVCQEPQWYLKYTWTQCQADKYGEWFIKEYRKTFASSLKEAKSEWQWFFMNYGWVVEEE